MKKIFMSIIAVLASLSLVGCGCVKQTAKGAVENYLNQYRNLSANVIGDMDNVIEKENITDDQKEIYRDILKKQYKDLKYKITDEKYDGDNATVEAKITVYNLYKAQKDADTYLNNHVAEFQNESGTFSNDLFMDYKLEQMKKMNETVDYTIVFKVTKDDDDNYKVTSLTKDDLEKIHGIYNYE